MKDYPRRDFLKQCGIGLGVVMTSNLWLNELLANPTKAVGETLLSNYFGFTKEQLKKLLEIGLSKGGEFAELYFEYRISNNLTYEEDIVKSASENIMLAYK